MGLTKISTAGLEDQSVTLDKLPHGTGSTDGKFLRANNGADPTFETVSTTPADGSVSAAKLNFPVANRNLLINGSCAIAQKATSFTGAGFTIDRWYVGSSDYTVDRVTDAPSNTGLTYSFRVSRSASTTGYVTVQLIELPTTGVAGEFYNGAKFTLSGYVKGTSGNTIEPTLRFYTGTGGSGGSSFTKTESAFTCNGSWQPFTFHFTVDENVGGSDKCVQCYFTILTNSTGQQTFFTGLQLESGETATSFQHRHITEELALCQRYFHTGYVFTANDPYFNGYFGGGSGVRWYDFPVTLRTSPTITFNSYSQIQVYESGSNGWQNRNLTFGTSQITHLILFIDTPNHNDGKLLRLSGGSNYPIYYASAEL
mgnify:CR=1 FL=1